MNSLSAPRVLTKSVLNMSEKCSWPFTVAIRTFNQQDIKEQFRGLPFEHNFIK